MKNQTTPMRTENSAKVIRLHLAIELSRKKWKLAFSDGRGGRARLRTVAGRDLQALQGEIAQAKRHFGLADEVETVSCYEAGREGFWVHRALTAHGGHLSIKLCLTMTSGATLESRLEHGIQLRQDVGDAVRGDAPATIF